MDTQSKESKGTATRNKIISCASKLFIKNGYNATGVNEILNEANIPKGSFYYHFKAKKDVALAVVKYNQEKMQAWFSFIAKDKQWNDFVNVFMDAIIQDAQDANYFGCPFAVLGCELAFFEPKIAKFNVEPMNGLISLFAQVLRKTNTVAKEIDDKAYLAFALFEGNVMYYRVVKDIEVLKRLKKQLIDISI